jgi:hypothetical protein
MTQRYSGGKHVGGMRGAVLAVVVAASCRVHAGDLAWTHTDNVLSYVDALWSTQRFRTRDQEISPFLVPLGVMKKRDGVWRADDYKPIVGRIERVTWSVADESIVTLFDMLRGDLAEAHKLRWECAGRGCGNAAEWASRVFNERLLYGRDEYMRYAAFEAASGEWITVYSAARTVDRQYLHVDIIRPR